MAKKVISKVVDKWKRKKWFPVFAPKLFQEAQIGESPAYHPDALIGRHISANLMTLTGNAKKQNIDIIFEIDNIRGNSAYTSVIGFEMSAASIKRRIRRDRNRLDASFKCKTTDNRTVQVKPLLLTGAKISSSVKKALRKKIKQQVLVSVEKMDFTTLLNDIVTYKLQKELKKSLSKICPIKAADVRILKLQKENKEKVMQAKDQQLDQPLDPQSEKEKNQETSTDLLE